MATARPPLPPLRKGGTYRCAHQKHASRICAPRSIKTNFSPPKPHSPSKTSSPAVAPLGAGTSLATDVTRADGRSIDRLAPRVIWHGVLMNAARNVEISNQPESLTTDAVPRTEVWSRWKHLCNKSATPGVLMLVS